MSLFKKLIDETQMPKAQECTDNYIFTKKLFLAGLRGLQSISNPVEKPCITVCNPIYIDLPPALALSLKT